MTNSVISIGTTTQRIDGSIMGFAGLSIYRLHIGVIYGFKSEYSNGFSVGAWWWK